MTFGQPWSRPLSLFCSHLHMGSLTFNGIGDTGARDMVTALQVNTTLKTLE
jgi:hypothetical protein